jgi:anti-sigma factor RsiW
MDLSSARAERTENLTKEDDKDHDKTRAVRARQRAIGRELRRVYDGVVNEPVPDEFLDLLRQIDETDDAGPKPAEKKS